jgi:Ca2+-binding EF-hand superfamily protein
METIFISATVVIISLMAISYFTTNGVGTMGEPLRQFSLFLMNKAPVGLVDLFSDRPGSGSRTWMKFGSGWFLLASISGFLAIWHKYDPTALDSLASIGWSYDDGSALQEFTLATLKVAFLYLMVGGAFVAISRSANNRLASEASASMVAVIYTAILLLNLILIPIIFSFVDITDEASRLDFVSMIINYGVTSMLFTAVLINVLATYSMRKEGTSSVSAWFLIMALTAKLVASSLYLLGEFLDSTQTVWMAEQILNGWVPLALIFAVAYHIIPYTAQKPIWSNSLLNAGMVLLFVTVPPFFVGPVAASDILTNIGALLLTFSLIPILATSYNLLATAASNSSAILKNPGAMAATLAMFVLPLFAVGGYFTSMDTFTDTAKMADMAEMLDNSFMFTVGGLMMLATVFTSYPLASGNNLEDSPKASLAVWFVLLGGITSTITMLIGGFTEIAVNQSAVEDVVASSAGFYLTASALFYLIPIGSIMTILVLIKTGNTSNKMVEIGQEVTDIDTYVLGGGVTTIQQLLGRGVGVTTKIIVGESEENDGGTTIIAVNAELHNDEIIEFPEEELDEEDTKESKGPVKELVMLLDYLNSSEQTVFEFFRSIDLDSSGEIDGFEFQQALKNSDVGDFPPWEIDGLVSAIDLNGDGKINLPELDISLARIGAELLPAEEESEEESEEEPVETETTSTPSEAQLNKMKKAELVELAESMGVSSSGTKKDLVEAILGA